MWTQAAHKRRLQHVVYGIAEADHLFAAVLCTHLEGEGEGGGGGGRGSCLVVNQVEVHLGARARIHERVGETLRAVGFGLGLG